MASARAFAFAGRNPRNRNRSVGSPASVSAAIAAEAREGVHSMARRTRRADQLIARIGDEGRTRIADERNCLLTEPSDDGGALGLARVIVIAAHRHFGADMRQELCGNPRILNQNTVGAAKACRRRAGLGRRGCRSESRRCAGRAQDAHSSSLINLFQFNRKRVIVQSFNRRLGRGSVIVFVVATSIILAALQASINAPTATFRSCLKEASGKATGEKVAGDAYEAYAAMLAACR